MKKYEDDFLKKKPRRRVPGLDIFTVFPRAES
jgi:hypothetical protein